MATSSRLRPGKLAGSKGASKYSNIFMFWYMASPNFHSKDLEQFYYGEINAV